ncbi:MAG: DUF484 family protein [Thioalkalivibrionaceae bacterium]
MTVRSPTDSDTDSQSSAQTTSEADSERASEHNEKPASARQAAKSTRRAASPDDPKSARKSKSDPKHATQSAVKKPRRELKSTVRKSITAPSSTPDTDRDAETPDVQLTSKDIEQWLRAHPDFFVNHIPLLEVLTIPHPVRGATSLLEAKLRYFRERDAYHRNQLQAVFHTAATNQRLVERLHRLSCRLLGTNDSETVLATICNELRENLTDERVEILLYPPALRAVSANAALPLKYCMDDDAWSVLQDIIEAGTVLCGRHRQTRLRAAFGGAGQEFGSAILAPLRVRLANTLDGHPDAATHSATQADGYKGIGLLAIGAKDLERFQSDMGTFLIDSLADLCAAALVSARASST